MTGVEQTCAWRIFHSDGLYPCYLQIVQCFVLGDYADCLCDFVGECNHRSDYAQHSVHG